MLYLIEHLKISAIYLLFVVIYAIVFALSGVDIKISLYPSILCIVFTIIFVGVDFSKYLKKHNELQRRLNHVDIMFEDMVPAGNTIESDYIELLEKLNQEKNENINDLKRKISDRNEYIILWAHQIKTPITAMGLLLQEDKNEENIKLKQELFEIEQYVDVTLQYMRMDSMSSDFVFREYNIINILRQAVKYYSRIFISKKLSLNLADSEAIAVTDEKWLLFVVKQIISNALKYTSEGGITIYIEETDKINLIIQDTGIGIAKEDIPRIFERGFTGYNGRMNMKSTGIGLYLSFNILKKLNHSIKIESELGKGTKVIITF